MKSENQHSGLGQTSVALGMLMVGIGTMLSAAIAWLIGRFVIPGSFGAFVAFAVLFLGAFVSACAGIEVMESIEAGRPLSQLDLKSAVIDGLKIVVGI